MYSKSFTTTVYFEWIEVSIVYLQLTYYYICYGFYERWKFFPPFWKMSKGGKFLILQWQPLPCDISLKEHDTILTRKIMTLKKRFLQHTRSKWRAVKVHQLSSFVWRPFWTGCTDTPVNSTIVFVLTYTFT